MKSGLNGLGSNSNGLILWENDATRFRIIFIFFFLASRGLNILKKNPKVCPSNPRFCLSFGTGDQGIVGSWELLEGFRRLCVYAAMYYETKKKPQVIIMRRGLRAWNSHVERFHSVSHNNMPDMGSIYYETPGKMQICKKHICRRPSTRVANRLLGHP